MCILIWFERGMRSINWGIRAASFSPSSTWSM
jgi:hypothetical protein